MMARYVPGRMQDMPVLLLFHGSSSESQENPADDFSTPGVPNGVDFALVIVSSIMSPYDSLCHGHRS